MNIRSATSTDTHIISHSLWANLATEMEPYSEINSIDITEELLRNVTESFTHLVEKNALYHLYVVESDEQLVGFIDFEEKVSELMVHNTYIQVRNIYVLPEYRNQGIGSELLSEMESHAKKISADYVEIPVEWNNTEARSFYKQNGYEKKKIHFTKSYI